MSKIVQVVNTMISNKSRIQSVIQNDDELFFRYKDKYNWSMKANNDGGFILFFYPGNALSLEQLAYLEPEDFMSNVKYVTYTDSNIGTREAFESFKDLYTILGEKVYGVDDVFDDILSDEDPF